jgi:hypothetical protein
VLISKTVMSQQHRNIIFRDETIGLLRHNTWNRPRTIVLNRGIVGDSTITTSSSDDDNEDSFSSSSPSLSSSPKKTHWRKQQLNKIENKFNKTEETLTIENEEDLQPMWKEMEGRVTKRKSRTLKDTKGKSGRMNIKKTEEEAWLQEGVYGAYNNDEEEDTDDDSKNNK